MSQPAAPSRPRPAARRRHRLPILAILGPLLGVTIAAAAIAAPDAFIRCAAPADVGISGIACRAHARAFSASSASSTSTPLMRIDWDTRPALPALPRPLSGHAAGLSHGALLIAGGTDFPTPLFQGGTKVWFDTIFALEPTSTRRAPAPAWQRGGTLPRPLAYAAAGTIAERLIVAGGSDAARHYADVFALEWRDGEVQQQALPPLPHPIAMAGAAVLARTLFVVGGTTRPDDTQALRSVWALDLASPSPAWTALPPLPGPGRLLPVVVAQDGRLHVISGASLAPGADGKPTRSYLTDAYAWSAATGWQPLPDVPRPIVAAPAVAWGPSHIFVLGGDDGALASRVAELKDAHPGFTRDLLAYHTIARTWTMLGALPAGLVTTQAVMMDDAIVIPGGEDRPGHRSAAVLRGRIAAIAEPRQTEVYVAGQEGYHTYRIPSLIVTTRGTLLAFAEGRRAGASDAGDIDLVLKRSTDGGATWSALQVVGDDGPDTFGNPCPVIDRRSGTIWLLTTQNLGTDREKDIIAGTSAGSRTVWVLSSTDDGVTWSTPVEITRSVKRPDWTWYATGPGVGIQTRDGRLVIPANHAEAGTGVHRSHLFFSRDRGRSWTLGASSDAGTNESQVVELADGRLMLNMRNHPPRAPANHRLVATSRDGGRTLSPAAEDAALVEPPAQASLLRLTTAKAQDRNRLLFANPASAKRERMTIRVSRDEGVSWPQARVLHEGPAAYSGLAVLPDWTIGVLYERGVKSAYETVTFARVTLEWLTEGQDRIAPRVSERERERGRGRGRR